MFTLKEGFERLNRSGVGYCVISDYVGLPSAVPKLPLDILTTQPDDVVALMGLVRKGYPEQFSMPDNPGLVVQVYKKSRGVFPDVFEAAIIKTYTMHNQVVRVPSVQHHGIMVLYRALFHYGMFKEKDQEWMRRQLAELAKSHTGMTRRTKYQSLAFTP